MACPTNPSAAAPPVATMIVAALSEAALLPNTATTTGPTWATMPGLFIGFPPFACRTSASMAAALHVAAGEDAGDVVQHVGGRVLVVAVVADQPALDDVDLLLRVLVD